MKTENRLNNQAASATDIARAIYKIAEGKELFIGFDRDGTIVPYADRPENALLDPDVHESLRALAIKPGVIAGIVSARSMALLRSEFDFQRLFIAGNYGLELALPKQQPQINEMARSLSEVFRNVRDRLAPLARPEINAIVEDHAYSVCVHWHTVPVESRTAMHHHVADVAKDFPQLLMRPQPTSYEFLADIKWDKGRALAALDEMVPATEGERAYVFIGDSPPDEAAFDWVNKRGGVSIRVGSGGLDTCSKFQVSDTKEIAKLILLLTEARSQTHW